VDKSNLLRAKFQIFFVPGNLDSVRFFDLHFFLNAHIQNLKSEKQKAKPEIPNSKTEARNLKPET